ncbi:hypothetical protein ACQEVI_24280 [Promicromonospora sp. CA-289599]|uniref:hypothetical protein n=1 Tax=Promicromonospora sp. CA-289599 TaxID=3240014 RepID=UPI003D8C5A33
MTNLSDFSDDELGQILDAPGAVLKGATLADGRPGAIRFIRETATGAKVFREAQQHENDFIQSVAIALRDRIKDEEAAELSPAAKVGTPEGVAVPEDPRPNPERDTAKAVELTAASIAVLRERADQQDLAAYGDWLLRIATEVVKATKSKEGGLFSKRLTVSEGEQDYLDRLTAALGR